MVAHSWFLEASDGCNALDTSRVIAGVSDVAVAAWAAAVMALHVVRKPSASSCQLLLRELLTTPVRVEPARDKLLSCMWWLCDRCGETERILVACNDNGAENVPA